MSGKPPDCRSCTGGAVKSLKTGLILLAVLSLGSVCLSSRAFAVTKQEALSKYEKAVTLSEELHFAHEDVFGLLPRIRLAGEMLLKNEFDRANTVLEDVLSELEILRQNRPKELQSRFRLEWLEIYLGIFQWYAVLALFGFVFGRWSRRRERLASGVPRKAWLMALLGGVLAVALSFFDLSRYGESSWAFFDIQMVMAVLCGFWGGWIGGAGAGILLAAFRLLLKPGVWTYPAAVLAAAFLGILFGRRMKDPFSAGRISWIAGCLAGIVHGLLVYLPMREALTGFYLVFSIVFLALLEGGGAAVFSAVVSGILREEKRRADAEELLRTKLLFLQAQLRPHFFFNALNTISAVCSRENASGARELILKLADFLRHTLKREHETATLREEIAFIEDYLEIEKARFGDRLEVIKDYKIAEAAWEARVPLLILQPLVENAVRHGLRKKTSGGWVRIGLEEDGGHLKVEITDNGVGEEPQFFEKLLRGAKTETQGLGIGVRNIHERLKRYFGGDAALSFKTAIGEGTQATVVLPVETEKQP